MPKGPGCVWNEFGKHEAPSLVPYDRGQLEGRITVSTCGAVGTFGRVDILINGAGTHSATPFLEITEDEVDRILPINHKSVFLGCQVFGQYLVERGEGESIIYGFHIGLSAFLSRSLPIPRARRACIIFPRIWRRNGCSRT
ncbi:MAG: SDR family NAD(P)-dependent oxidoreductase [Verrucomicrobia bacterium]|nr:SDR family NAD(P)-dependent oxidoreductase [Verrucomicrobiota bacterium]